MESTIQVTRAFRPSDFGHRRNNLEDPVIVEARNRRVVIYAERVRNGKPLFDDPVVENAEAEAEKER